MKRISLLWLVVALSDVCGYHSGAPASSCYNMEADHNGTYQVGPMPYILNMSSDAYTCGERLTVTLSAIGGNFRGFLCQVRTIKNVYETVGTLAASGETVMNHPCGPGRALTNSESSPKTSVKFTWTARENHGNVLFVCTIINDISIYYLRRQMANISFAGNCDTSSYSPETDSTTEIVVSTSAGMATITSSSSTSSVRSETSSNISAKPSILSPSTGTATPSAYSNSSTISSNVTGAKISLTTPNLSLLTASPILDFTTITTVSSSIVSRAVLLTSTITPKPTDTTTFTAYITSGMDDFSLTDSGNFTKTNRVKPNLTSPSPVNSARLYMTADITVSSYSSDSTFAISNQTVKNFKGFKKHAIVKCNSSDSIDVSIERDAILTLLLAYFVWQLL